MKEVFDWCKKCALFYPCYHFDVGGEIASGPDFLEPACGDGPVKEK